MRYPLISYYIDATYMLHIPDPATLRAVYESNRAIDPMTPFPYWAQIWPSAKAMLQFLQEDPSWIRDKTVVELGAGIALPSLMMAEHMKHLVVSDHDDDAVMLMEKNIAQLQCDNALARNIDWNAFPNDLQMEVLMLCDVNYAPDQFDGLMQLIQTQLEMGTLILLATPQRITASTFVESIQSMIRRSASFTVEHMGSSVDISILILSA